MTDLEQRLTAALNMLADTAPDSDLLPLAVQPRPAGRASVRWLAPGMAAVAIALIGVAAAAVPQVWHRSDGGGRSGPGTGKAAPSAFAGLSPIGIAFDGSNQTVYVAAWNGEYAQSGNTGELTMINARTCNALRQSGCGAGGQVSTSGLDVVGVAVDERTHTVYAVNKGSDTVVLINAATCNATDQAGCTAKPPLVRVGDGPEFLAVNQVTNTIYVTNTRSGTVSVIDGATCNASDASGCGRLRATVRAGRGPSSIAVDAQTNTLYVGLSSGVVVINGATCDRANISGCANAPAIIPADEPDGIAVDDANHTVYVSGGRGTVTVVDRDTCEATDTKGCASEHVTAKIGNGPRGGALVATAGTLYVTNTGADTVSMMNTASCGAAATTECTKAARAFPAGFGPGRIAVDPATHTVYVINTGGNDASMINSRTCNAATRGGCPTELTPGDRLSARAIVRQVGRTGRPAFERH